MPVEHPEMLAACNRFPAPGRKPLRTFWITGKILCRGKIRNICYDQIPAILKVREIHLLFQVTQN